MTVMLFSSLWFRGLDAWLYVLFGFPVDSDFLSSGSPMNPFHIEPG